jgi:hypothetical protein
MRWLHLGLAALFGWCVIIQFNDPDWLPWVAVYGTAAGVAALAAAGRRPRVLPLALGAACVGWMATLLGGVGDFLAQGEPGLILSGMSPDRPWVEETREFVGLAIVLGVCLAYGWFSRRPAAGAPPRA